MADIVSHLYEMEGFQIVKECEVNLNILPLGSYVILIGMDWLEQHHVMLDCLHKSILCNDSQENQMKVQGIPKKVYVRQISSLQVKKCVRKGYKLFAVSIQDIEFDREQPWNNSPFLKNSRMCFPRKSLDYLRKET